MKNQNTHIRLRKLFFLFGLLFIVSYIASISYGKTNDLTNSMFSAFTPDSIPSDTTFVNDAFEDTTIFTEGLDTILLFSEDTTIAENDSIDLRSIDITKDIAITPGGISKDVEKGLFGYHIEGMFANNHMPDDVGNVNYPDAWDWLADLKPRVIRFPGGATSRWMHLLPYDTNNDGIDDVFPTGYGYDLNELIRFYDLTNGLAQDYLTLPIPLTIADIVTDLSDGDCATCGDWMSGSYIDGLEKVALKYFAQSTIPATQPQLYIDQFINLIDHIQDREGYTVDVILDLNVFSESASQCKRIVNYLRDHSVNVVGVEMGNECNLQWGEDIMGYHIFDDYWKFINGYGVADIAYFTPEYATWMTNFYTYVFNAKFRADHNFIAAFKTDPAFNCKVGISAANLKDDPDAIPPIYYALRKDEPEFSDDWNAALVTHYGDYFTVGSNKIYKFDAVILHPYYNPGHNWEDIALDNYCRDYYPTNIACINVPGCNWPANGWQYAEYEERLRNPFEQILGSTPPDEFGNFKQFIKSRYKQSYDAQNAALKFYLSNKNATKKELWTTEWNLKDVKEGADPFDQLLFSSYCNSFPHGLLIQEWFLKDLKLNFDPGCRQGFHTYSTFHSWGGGSPYAMVYNPDVADRANHLDDLGNPEPLSNPPTGQLWWLKRTMYHTFDLLSEINSKNLQYLPSTFSMFAGNVNIQPTVFWDQTNHILYVYYSNMKDETQSYVVNTGNLINFFPGADAIVYGSANIYNVDPLRPYSNSGRSSLFDINLCYNDVNHLHPYEIQGITGPILNIPECTGLPGGAICVTVPGSSYGYFTIPVYNSPREGILLTENQLHIYPNPAAKTFKIECDIPQQLINELVVSLLDLTGQQVFSTTTTQNADINIANIPSGIYLAIISNKEKTFSITKKLIKIE